MFIALTLPEAVKEAIARTQAELRGALVESRVSWTKREQFHLTLVFLGNVPPARADAVVAATGSAVAGCPPMLMYAEGLGFFPNIRFPRVLWAGVHDSRETLPELQRTVAAATAEFATKKPEAKFTGHVTLGRVLQFDRREVPTLEQFMLGRAETLFGQWTAAKVEIIRSVLLPTGSHYTTLASVPLATAG